MNVGKISLKFKWDVPEYCYTNKNCALFNLFYVIIC